MEAQGSKLCKYMWAGVYQTSTMALTAAHMPYHKTGFGASLKLAMWYKELPFNKEETDSLGSMKLILVFLGFLNPVPRLLKYLPHVPSKVPCSVN